MFRKKVTLDFFNHVHVNNVIMISKRIRQDKDKMITKAKEKTRLMNGSKFECVRPVSVFFLYKRKKIT